MANTETIHLTVHLPWWSNTVIRVAACLAYFGASIDAERLAAFIAKRVKVKAG